MMTSDNPQSIEIKGSNGIKYSHINNLTLSNTSEEGVTFVTPICISGIFNQGDTLTSGDLILTGNVGFTNESYTGNIIINETTDESATFEPFKEFMLEILEDGGLVNHYLNEKE